MKFVLSNDAGNEIDLWENDYFNLISLDGQTAATENISSVVIGDIDGDFVNNAQTQPRSLVLNLRIKSGANVENAKRAILAVAKIKKNATIYWSQNDRYLQINGIVEAVTMPRWNNAVTMQITLHCSNPFWEDIAATIQEINAEIGLHYFTAADDHESEMLFFVDEGIALGEYDFNRTKDFYNGGDVAVGMKIDIVAYDTVHNPIITNGKGEFFGIGSLENPFTMQDGDIITITTERGNKSVMLNGETNLLGYIKPFSTWLQLEPAENTFTINSNDVSKENMTFVVSYKQRYI